jgi:sucrose phosphorylase
MSDRERKRPLVPDTASLAGILGRRLQKIYGESFNETTVNRILALVPGTLPAWPEWDERDFILITYGNSITRENEPPLRTLHKFIKENLSNYISCVHILPFFPYTSDDGFSVTDYMTVNPALGSWDDIEAIAGDFCLMTDLVINHVSSAHQWFINYLENRSPGKGYFIEAVSGDDYSQVARPRSSPLFTRFKTTLGEKDVWTTFSSDQIDVNFSNQEVLVEFIRIMVFYIRRGARFIRLDAIAYLWKCSATACLHLDQTHEIVKLLRDVAGFVRPGTVIITETNVPNRENWSYFGKGDEANMVYQFSLPPLLLYSIFYQNTEHLTSWAKQIPDVAIDQTFLNYTASHDGIGVRPLEGLVSEANVSNLIAGMSHFGGLVSMKTNTDGSLSPYEINIAWFDAMKGTSEGPDDLHANRFLTSQVIMMSLKGIPAIYIHSLLATPNDRNRVQSTGRARSVNRSILNETELADSLLADTTRARIYRELKRIISIRRQHTAFNPRSQQKILESINGIFAFERFDETSEQRIVCVSNLSKRTINFALPGYINKSSGFVKNPELLDLITGERFSNYQSITINACRTMWILIPVSHILK